jgi:RNA polymerase sigma-70 factor (ECF subfamily)
MEDRFRGLIEPLFAKALAFARSLSRSRSDGDDLFQEAVVRAMTNLGSLRDEATFRSWFYRILITVHSNRSRRAFWRRFLQLSDAQQADEQTSVGDYRVGTWSPDAAESVRRGRDALATLPPEQRESIVLFEVEGWKVDEIAALLGISASAVKSRLSRGRERLRAFYEKRFGEVVPPVAIEETP